MAECFDVLRQLASGGYHSGEALGSVLGISRTAVWKHVGTLGDLGVEIHRVRGKGYRLAWPLELLDAEHIRRVWQGGLARRAQLEVHHSIDSTNRHLLKLAAQGAPSGYACLAERQTEGRGRLGRSWVSPFGNNVYLSVLWRYASSPADLGGLSLSAAVGVARVLRGLGLSDIGVKWPNDLLWRGKKISGILLEMFGEPGGPCCVVVGVGVNVRMGRDAGELIDQPWTDMEAALGRRVSRNEVAGQVLRELTGLLDAYPERGLAQVLDEWRSLDVMAGCRVRLQMAHAVVEGVALGVDERGALLLNQDGRVSAFHGGEISLRAAPGQPIGSGTCT